MNKFTFKKQSRLTGLASIGEPDPSTEIKYEKKWVGSIVAPTYRTSNNKWSVRFMVKGSLEGNPNCSWHWVSIKQRFDTEPEARQWVQDNVDKILALNLHQMEN